MIEASDESAFAEVKDKLKDLVHRAAPELDLSSMTEKTSLRKLGLDSLDLANLFLMIEDSFKVKVSDEVFEQLDTVESILAHLRQSK